VNFESRVDATYINKLNKIKVLDVIRTKGPISRAEVAKLTKLSAPTVTRIVDALIHQEKLVSDLGTVSSDLGRPPNLVQFLSGTKFIIGIDLGRTKIHGALANLDAKVLSESQEETDSLGGFAETMQQVTVMVQRLIRDSGVAQSEVYGIGLALGGLIDKQNSIVEFSPDFGWVRVDPAAALSQRLGLPVRVDNVTRVVAIGELHFGIGREIRDFICVNIGYGIGAGIIVDGEPFYGSHGVAGEFGHTVVSTQSQRLCHCGNQGCIEAIASGSGIAATAAERVAEGQPSSLLKKCGGELDRITAEMVTTEALAGDALARGIFQEAMDSLGLGIMNLINLFDPKAVVLCGRVALSNELVFGPIKEIISRRSINIHRKEIGISEATFGTKAAVMGAIALILDDVLNLSVGR